MSRQIVRDMKRAMSAGTGATSHIEARLLAKESALSLLARSINFGHRRLAVIRLGMAVHAGANVPAAHWDYCLEAASSTRDATLRALFVQAAGAARPVRDHVTCPHPASPT